MTTVSHSNRESVSVYSVLAFFLGLSLNDNIFALFSYGSTYFYFGQLLSVFVFSVLFVKRNDAIYNSIKEIPKEFVLFFAIVVFSVLVGIPFSHSISLYLYRSAASLFLLFINVLTLVNVIALKKHHNSIISGIVVGLVLNLLFSVIAYFSFSSGTTFSLKQFSIRKYDFIDFYYVFRTQGMFLEPSHFVRYLVLTSFVLIGFRLSKKKTLSFIDFVFASVVLMVLALTRSGSIAIFAGGVLFFLIAIFFSNGVSSKTKKSIGGILILLVSASVLFFVLSGIDLPRAISSIVSGANISSEENAERLNSIKYGLSLISAYPFGAGWGMSGTLYESSPFVAPFSFVLTLTLETGVFGALAYVFCVARIIARLIKRNNIISICLCASLLCMLALQLGTDYAFDPLIMTVIGFSICACKGRANSMGKIKSPNTYAPLAFRGQ